MKAARVVGLWVGTAFRAAPFLATLLCVNAVIATVLGPLVSLGVAHMVAALAAGHSLQAPLVLTATILVVSAVLSVLAPPLGDTADEKIRLHIRRDVLSLATRVPSIAHHESPAHADRLDLIVRDIRSLSGIYRATSTIGSVLGTTTVLSLLASVHPLLLLLFPITLVATGCQAWGSYHQQRSWQEFQKLRRNKDRMTEILADPHTGVEVRCFGLMRPLLQVASTGLDFHRSRIVGIARTMTVLASGAWVLSGASYVAALLWMLGNLRAGDASIVQVTLLVMVIGQLSMTAQGFTANISMVMGSVHAFGRYEWLKRYAKANAWADSVGTPPATLQHGITFDNVTFRYPTDELSDDTTIQEARDETAHANTLGPVQIARSEPSLTKINLHLPAGTAIAFVGANGAGKSTVIKLLARLYDPTEGAVLIDGVPLHTIDPRQWRKRVSAGFQDFAKFEFQVADTIGVGDLAHRTDRELITEAAEAGQATGIIEQLDEGLDSQLGVQFEGGSNLSGGQWQRLALSRAFMRQEPLLMLLDEPTAALDPEAEQLIYEQYAATARELAQRTGAVTVMVSHRFSTVRMADLIVVIDQGQVSEMGTHTELLQRGGRYAELFTLQSDAYA